MAQNPLWHGTTGRNWTVAHAAIRKSERLWAAIAFDGIQADGSGGLFEERRCPACGLKLARKITALEAVRILSEIGQLHAQSLHAVVSAGEAVQQVAPRALPTADS